MKIVKVENYDAGYSKTELLKKCTAAIAASALILGGAASCNQLEGDVAYDGGMDIVSDYDDRVSDSDIENVTLAGSIAYAPSEE